jgi:hypothetical protein
VKTGAKAVLLSKAKRTDPIALADALTREREVLLKRADELSGAIEQLRSGGTTPEEILVEDPARSGELTVAQDLAATHQAGEPSQ